MKSKFFKSVAALLSICFLLTGCSNDDIAPKVEEKPLEKDSQFYINVAIASPQEQSTRAGNSDADSYEHGTEAEQYIHNILFVFYNSANKYVGNTIVTLGNDGKYYTNGEEVGSKNSNYTDAADALGDASKALINLLVPVDVSAGALKPAYVMAYVNPTVEGYGDGVETSDNVASDLKRGLEQSLGVTRTLEQVIPCKDLAHPHSGFTMSNAVYYSDNDNSQRPRIAVKILEDLLDGNDVDEAKKNNNLQTFLSDKKAIVIYVERVVAKVNLSLELKDGKLPVSEVDNKPTNQLVDINEENTYELDFNVLGWGLSNVEKGTFLVKNFRSGGSNVTDYDNYFPFINMDQNAAIKALTTDGGLTNPNWNFSEPENEGTEGWITTGRRSFWAFSPSYFNVGNYPSYADEVKSKKSDGTYDDNSKNYSLAYRSFKDIVIYNTTTSTFGLGAYGQDCGKDLYALEHTMEESVVTDNAKRGVTCALIVGQYKIKNLNGHDTDYEDAHTFYVRNGIKNNGEEGHWIYPTEDDLTARILSTATPSVNNRIFKSVTKDGVTSYEALNWTSTETQPGYMSANVKSCFIIDHPSKDITGGKYTPNRFVSLQLTKLPDDGTTLYLKGTDGKQRQIVKTNPTADQVTFDEVNRALYALLNGVEKYEKGYAFFAVPIEHLWRQTDKIGDDGFSAKLGQYGIVRNHYYRINVKGIQGIGTGIGDIEVPIIPNVETEKYYVKTELRVMPWRTLDTQDVLLKP